MYHGRSVNTNLIKFRKFRVNDQDLSVIFMQCKSDATDIYFENLSFASILPVVLILAIQINIDYEMFTF